MPSVQAQTYPYVEHVVISDGPDLELAERFKSTLMAEAARDVRGGRNFPSWYHHVPEHDPAPHWGHHARLLGIELAAGDLITYCDDDDALRPRHCELLAQALADNPEAGFAIGLMASHTDPGNENAIMEIGHGPPSCGNVGTPMLMHRREILEQATWGPASDFEDWELVNRWLHVNIPYVRVGEVTVDVWPSLFFGRR